MKVNKDLDNVLEKTIQDLKKLGIIIDTNLIILVCKYQFKFLSQCIDKSLSLRLIYLGSFVNKEIIKKFKFVERNIEKDLV